MRDLTTQFGREQNRSASLYPLLRIFLVLLLGLVSSAGAAGSSVQQDPSVAFGPGQPFTIADLDGDRRPDVAGIQIGRSEFSRTEYWVQLQLSATGRQTILVVAPAGGLQIAARDVNGDHIPDLILTTAWFEQPVAILLNDGRGTFSRADSSSFPEAFSKSSAGWDAATDRPRESVGAPPQSRSDASSETARLTNSRSETGQVSSLNKDFRFNRSLVSHRGRAPPSELL